MLWTMSPETNELVTTQELFLFQPPTTGIKNKISAHKSHHLSSNTIHALNFPVMSQRQKMHLQHKHFLYREGVNYLVTIWRTVIVLKQGPLLSAKILPRSTLNGDFVECLTSAKRMPAGK